MTIYTFDERAFGTEEEAIRAAVTENERKLEKLILEDEIFISMDSRTRGYSEGCKNFRIDTVVLYFSEKHGYDTWKTHTRITALTIE